MNGVIVREKGSTQKWSGRLALAIATILGFLFAAAPSALAAPPQNDSFAQAQTIAGASLTQAGVLTEATLESGEPAHYGNFANSSVWYSWTAPQTATVGVRTLEGPPIGVYTGSAVASLARVDLEGGTQTYFPAVAGTTYRIAVAGTSIVSVDSFTLKLETLPPPANDNFADSEALNGETLSIEGTTASATLEAGEPNHFNQGNTATVWYSWQAPKSGTVDLDTCTSITALAVYSGSSINGLTLAGAGACSVRFEATAGTTYRIAATTSEGKARPFSGRMEYFEPPPNDNFAQAEALSGSMVNVDRSLDDASLEAGEPAHFGSFATSSVWFKWTAPYSGSVTIGATQNASVVVYKGSTLGALTKVSGPGNSTMFNAVVGTSYSIAVIATSISSVNDFNLDINLGPPDTTPPNTTISSGPTGTISTTKATFAFSGSPSTDTWKIQCKIDSEPYIDCVSPKTFLSLADGTHTVSFRAEDFSGNQDPTPATRTFTVDAPPDTVLDSSPSDTIKVPQATFEFSGIPANDTAKIQCRLDQNAYEDCTSPKTFSSLADGQHSVYIRAQDANGNQDPTPAVRDFTVDTTPPDTILSSGPTGTIAINQATFTFSGNLVEDTEKIQCRINLEPFSDCVSPKTFSALTDGNYTVQFRAEDAVGNQDLTPATRSFSVDIPPPDTTIDSGPSGTISTNQATFTFSGNPVSETSRIQCKIDSGAFSDCSSPRTFTGLAEGVHTVLFRAENAVGKQDQSPASRSFIVDTVPNTSIDSGPSGQIAVASFAFSFSSDQLGSTFECRLDGDNWVPCVSPWSYSNVADGSHSFQVRAVDGTGNTDSSPATQFFTVQVPTNSAAPRISSVVVTGAKKLKKGKFSTFGVRITNSGGSAADGVVASLSGNGIKARVSAGSIAPGTAKAVKVKIRPRRAGSLVLTFKVASTNAGNKRVQKRVLVRK